MLLTKTEAMVADGWSSERRLAGVSALAVVGLGIAVCFLTPGSTPWLPRCPFLELTGLYCPGCGCTRMFYFLVHGHPLLAFQQNALALILLPFVLYELVRQLMPSWRVRRIWMPPRWEVALLVVVVGFGVARNLPFEPFCRLSPGGVCVNSELEGRR